MSKDTIIREAWRPPIDERDALLRLARQMGLELGGKTGKETKTLLLKEWGFPIVDARLNSVIEVPISAEVDYRRKTIEAVVGLLDRGYNAVVRPMTGATRGMTGGLPIAEAPTFGYIPGFNTEGAIVAISREGVHVVPLTIDNEEKIQVFGTQNGPIVELIGLHNRKDKISAALAGGGKMRFGNANILRRGEGVIVDVTLEGLFGNEPARALSDSRAPFANINFQVTLKDGRVILPNSIADMAGTESGDVIIAQNHLAKIAQQMLILDPATRRMLKDLYTKGQTPGILEFKHLGLIGSGLDSQVEVGVYDLELEKGSIHVNQLVLYSRSDALPLDLKLPGDHAQIAEAFKHFG